MTEYRIRGARYSLFDDRLVVQYRSGENVRLALGVEGRPEPYRGQGPVLIRIDDGSGGHPKVVGTADPAQDDYGDVLTELDFRGTVVARVEPEFLVVTAAGSPEIVEGADCLPATAGDIAGAGLATWTSLEEDGGPHPPVG